jgi:hypothetical protein
MADQVRQKTSLQQQNEGSTANSIAKINQGVEESSRLLNAQSDLLLALTQTLAT